MEAGSFKRDGSAVMFGNQYNGEYEMTVHSDYARHEQLTFFLEHHGEVMSFTLTTQQEYALLAFLQDREMQRTAEEQNNRWDALVREVMRARATIREEQRIAAQCREAMDEIAGRNN